MLMYLVKLKVIVISLDFELSKLLALIKHLNLDSILLCLGDSLYFSIE